MKVNENTQLTLARLLKEANNDKALKLLPPAVVPTKHKRVDSELSSDWGPVFKSGRIVMGIVFWPGNDVEMRSKVEECLSCSDAGKNIKTLIPNVEVKKLPQPLEIGERVEIEDFVGPVEK